MRTNRQIFAVATLALALVGCGAGLPSPSQPDDALTPSESLALRTGHSVTRALQFERNGARYVGGVAYQIVAAPAEEVSASLSDPTTLRDMLPSTKKIVEVDGVEDARRLQLRQGNNFVEAEYTIVVESDDESEMRFWLDRTRPSDIDDVWGFFRVEPIDERQSLITVGVALDLGPGVVRLLFEKRIQELILSTPERMKQALEERGSSRDEIASARPAE